MRVCEVRETAARWVSENAAALNGFCGAYLSGSILEKSPGEEFPETSDADIVLVLDDPEAFSHEKSLWQGVLLEITPMAASIFEDAEHVLRTHFLAWAMGHDSVLSDPTGLLAKRHAEAVLLWQDGKYIRARRDGFLNQLRNGGMCFDAGAPFQDKITSWAFGAGIAVFPILTAAGENCTVRKRFSAARKALEAYGEDAFCDRITALLTGENFEPACLSVHMDALERVFDCALLSKGLSESWRFRCEIAPDTRAAAIGDTRRLVRSDHPQDALFWMLATFSRAMTVLWLDDRALWEKHLADFRSFTDALGVREDADIKARREELLKLLPEIEAVTERILKKRGK